VAQPEVLRRKLAQLEEYIVILERLRRYSLDEFLDDPERYGSAERFLQLAIESLLDMGNHVVAELALGEVRAYSDLPRILAEKGHLSPILAEKWVRMIGFRNILVHEYLAVDRTIVHRVLAQDLSDLRELAAAFAHLL